MNEYEEAVTGIDYCSDSKTRITNETPLSVLFVPCASLGWMIPFMTLCSAVLLMYWTKLRKKFMKWQGLQEEDIESIVSARRRYDDYDKAAVSNVASASASDEEAAEQHHNQVHNHNYEQYNLPNEKNDQGQELFPRDLPPPPNGPDGVRVFHLPYLVKKYGSHKLRLADSIFRKSLHFAFFSFQLFQLFAPLYEDFGIPQVLPNSFVEVTQSSFLSSLGALVVFAVAYRGDNWVSNHIYGGVARVRDGHMGRLNLLVSSTATTLSLLVCPIIVFVAILPNLEPDQTRQQLLMTALFVAPVAVGDALGEFIGSPLGGRYFWTFAVKGLGEVNRKSVEGCLAVFLGSLVSCLVMSVAHGGTTYSWILFCIGLALLSTLSETLAFRSTDNFVIPFANVLLGALVFGPLVGSFQQ